MRLKLFGIFFAICFLAVGAQPQKAEARSIVSVLALAPDAIFHVVTVGTDTAEYVADKVPVPFHKIDYVADAGVEFFHGLAHPTPAVVAAKAQAKLAKRAAKAAARAAKAPK